jgi:uncharacterized protein with beta-barrel porin domain
MQKPHRSDCNAASLKTFVRPDISGKTTKRRSPANCFSSRSRPWGLAILTAIAWASASHAQAPNLGTAVDFAVLAGSTVTNVGATVLYGNLGVSPGSAITGFPPGVVAPPSGTFIGDAVAVQAQVDLANAYNAAASRPTTADLTGQNLGGLTLTPGVYNFATTAQLNGTLTLNSLGNPNAVFIFNIGSTLITGSGASVNVIGGGLGSNVYWRVGSSATLGTTTSFIGDILALTSITLNTGADITCGSALARNGAVTLDTNTIAIMRLSACSIAAPLLPTPIGTGGVTPGGAVAAAINAGFAAALAENNNVLPAGFPQGFLTLSGLSPALQSAALQQLAGEVSTGVAPAGIQAMNSFLSLVLNPFAGNPTSDNRNGFGPAPPGMVVKTLGYADNAVPPKAPAYGAIDKAIAISDFDPRRWGVWGAAYGGQGEFAGNAFLGTHDLSARVYGFATGVDYRLLPNTIVGFALGGGSTNFGLSNGLGGGRSDMFQAAIYSSTRIGAAYVSSAVSYAMQDFTTDQQLSIVSSDHLTAKFVANNIGTRIEGGYRFVLPGFASASSPGITPYAALQAQAFHTPAYSEDATSDFARAFGASTTTAYRTELGAWFDQAHQLDSGMVLVLRGRAAWAHDEVTDPGINVSFLSLPGSQFTVSGTPMPRDLLLATAGAELRFRGGITISAQFEGEFADHAMQYGGRGRVRYVW